MADLYPIDYQSSTVLILLSQSDCSAYRAAEVFYQACINGDLNVIKLLLAAGYGPSAWSDQSSGLVGPHYYRDAMDYFLICFQAAVDSGNMVLVKFLLSQELLSPNHCWSLLDLLTGCNQTCCHCHQPVDLTIVKLMCLYGCGDRYNRLLAKACRQRDLALVETLVWWDEIMLPVYLQSPLMSSDIQLWRREAEANLLVTAISYQYARVTPAIDQLLRQYKLRRDWRQNYLIYAIQAAHTTTSLRINCAVVDAMTQLKFLVNWTIRNSSLILLVASTGKMIATMYNR